MKGQLPLVLDPPDHYRLELFRPGAETSEAWSRVQAVVAGRERFGFLCGGSGSGKTHLLVGAARAASGLYFDLPAMRREVSAAGLDPEAVLEAADGGGLVAIDGVHALAGDPDWERAVFHLYNAVAETGGRLLAAADGNPNSLGLEREDLRSRLNWGGVFPLGRLSDAERLRALQGHAEDRGLGLPDEVGYFLLRHYSRSMHQLMAALDAMDAAALAERRRLTIPFVKDRLGV